MSFNSHPEHQGEIPKRPRQGPSPTTSASHLRWPVSSWTRPTEASPSMRQTARHRPKHVESPDNRHTRTTQLPHTHRYHPILVSPWSTTCSPTRPARSQATNHTCPPITCCRNARMHRGQRHSRRSLRPNRRAPGHSRHFMDWTAAAQPSCPRRTLLTRPLVQRRIATVRPEHSPAALVRRQHVRVSDRRETPPRSLGAERPRAIRRQSAPPRAPAPASRSPLGVPRAQRQARADTAFTAARSSVRGACVSAMRCDACDACMRARGEKGGRACAGPRARAILQSQMSN